MHRTRRAGAPWAISGLAFLTGCPKSPTPPPPVWTGPDRVANALVVIHGVGNQEAGYSKPLQDRLKEKVGGLHVLEVLWSDLGTLVGLRSAGPPQARLAVEEWQRQISEAESRHEASRTGGPDAARAQNEYETARGYIGPVVRYEYLSPEERRKIQQRLREALDVASRHADRVVLVAHSLGSVIAFDVLHGWEGGPAVSPVAHLCTMGSPLDKGVFRKHNGRPLSRPTSAGDWVNVYSEWDPIASALAGHYTDVRDVPVKSSSFPITAHTAYWTHDDVVALLAGWMSP